MPPAGGNRSSLSGLAAQLAQRNSPVSYSWGGKGTGYDISQFSDTFNPAGLFSPGLPLVPEAPDRPVRVWDFPVSTNTNITPRVGESIDFNQLRELSYGHVMTRLCIETRKDQIESVEWVVRPRDPDNATAELENRALALTDFFAMPDGETPFATWVRELIEEVLVIDAPAVEVRYNRGGDIIGLDIIDGSTIKVLVDETGRRPRSPAPAYEQIIKGRPWVLLEDGSRVNTDDPPERSLTHRELIYMPRNPRISKVYGFAPVEQIVLTANIGLRRELQQLYYFSEGNIPRGMVNGPDGWTPDQLQHQQEHWDSVFAGNLQSRVRLLWAPAGSKYQAFIDSPFKDKFDEWLSRIVCYAFSLPPNAFVERVNRATAETAQEAALSEGLGPLLAWVKRFIDSVIQRRMGHTDLEFSWQSPGELDQKTQAEISVMLVKEGLITRNEGRESLGFKPAPNGNILMVDTTKGPVPLSVAANPPEPVQSGDSAGAGGAPGDLVQSP